MLVGAQRLDVELGDVGQLEQQGVLGPGVEVVEREHEAGVLDLGEHGEQVVVDQLVLDELEHDAVGRQRERPERHQELAVDVEERALVADEALEADVGERGDEHRGGGPVAVDRAAVLADGAVEELEGLDVEVGVEDRLAREHHAGG